MKKLESAEQFNEYKNGDGTIYIITAGWCPDCRVIDPIMPHVEEAFGQNEFVSIDLDEYIVKAM